MAEPTPEETTAAGAYATDADYSQEAFSAGSVIAEAERESALDAVRAEQAETAGVKDARFIGYAEVLAAYEGRSDTEHLADRRARENAATAAEQDFTRVAGYDGESGAESDSGFTTAGAEATEPEPTP